MKLQTKRVFITNLPDNINESDLTQKFTDYGTVSSVEIKQRKNIRENQSAQFAYVHIDIDTTTLHNCINEFASKKWKGHWLEVQEAKESFMDRLKREREQTEGNKSPTKINNADTPAIDVPKLPNYANTTNKINTTQTITEYDSSSEDEQDSSGYNSSAKLVEPKRNGTGEPEDTSEMIIKINKGKTIEGGLKIESVTPLKSPVTATASDAKKLTAREAAADQKRVNSLIQMKKEFQKQKSLIKSALANIDTKPKNKIVFDDNYQGEVITLSKKTKRKDQNNSKVTIQAENKNSEDKLTLFEDEDNEEDDEQYNFEIKEHLQGKKGQKLMQLQSRFKNDKRFEMDARFLEEEELKNDEQPQIEGQVQDVDMSQEEEKKKQFEILEEVLGKKISRKVVNNDAPESKRPKMMLRFDPSQPDHSKYELKEPAKPEKIRKKRKGFEVEPETEQVEEILKPEVSKTTFYKVAVDLKDALHEKEQFSLASMFSKEIPEEEQDIEATETTGVTTNLLTHERNPFKYDSSTDEEEGDDEKTEQAPAGLDANKLAYTNALQRARPVRLWTESFFFKDDDFRLQEGFDFVKRLEGNPEEDFSQLRRNLKVIVKAKVKNNERKNRRFKKKLGGKKRLRVKKAMKR